MSGMSVGARGETAVDMRASGFEAKGSALYHLHRCDGRGVLPLVFAQTSRVFTLPWRGRVDANEMSGGVG
jgi:hypothetical protein